MRGIPRLCPTRSVQLATCTANYRMGTDSPGVTWRAGIPPAGPTAALRWPEPGNAALSRMLVAGRFPRSHVTNWAGRMQQLMVGVIAAWIVMVALRVQARAAGLALTPNPSPDARERGAVGKHGDTGNAGIG